jgi:hypothetical protein
MPIIASEIQYRLSGGASNTDPDTSLGGVKSSTSISGTLFDDVSSQEATEGLVEYRCFYVHNNNDTLTLIAPKVWIQSNTPSATTTVAVGVGTSVQGSTEQTVANEGTAPSGVTFSEPSDFASGVPLGDIPGNGHRAVWVRRTVSAGTAIAADSFTLRVEGETNP